MKIVGIIPARGGSKGVPRKNIKVLGNKPLLQYTTEAALNSCLSKVLLSTDDSEIAEVGKKLGVSVPFLRSNELAMDETPTLPVLQHAIDYLKKEGEIYDAVCILQPTNPFRTTEDINNACNKFITEKTDSLVSVLEVPHEFNPHWLFFTNEKNQLIPVVQEEIIPRRQDLPKAYFRDGSIYLTKTDVLMNLNSIYGDSVSYYETDSTRHVNIDTLDDWKKAEQKLKELS